MHRRRVLSGCVVVGSVLAGCSSDGTDALLDETVDSDTNWQLSLSEGDELLVELTNEEGRLATVEVRTPDGQLVTTRDARSSVEFSVKIDRTGDHPVTVLPYGTASITATVE